jgi:hypothetical protein
MAKFETLIVQLVVRVSEDDAHWRHETTAMQSFEMEMPLPMFDEKKFATVVSNLIGQAREDYVINVANQDAENAKRELDVLGLSKTESED